MENTKSTQEEKALKKALYMHNHYKNDMASTSKKFSNLMPGYRDFTEKVSGDALLKLHSVLYDELLQHSALRQAKLPTNINGLAFKNVHLLEDGQQEQEPKLTATLVDDNGVALATFTWQKNQGTGFDMCVLGAVDHDTGKQNTIVKASIDKDVDFTMSRGDMGYGNFAEFIDILDHIKSSMALNYNEVLPGSDNSYIMHNMAMMDYSGIVKLDGGLPGELCLYVNDTMISDASINAHKIIVEKMNNLVPIMDAHNVGWSQAYICLPGGYNHYSIVRSPEEGRIALLHTGTSLIADHDTTLTIIDRNPSGQVQSSTIMALKRGAETLSAIEAFEKGDGIDFPTSSYDHINGVLEQDATMLQTGSLATSLFYTGNLEMSLEEVRDNKEDMTALISTDFDELLLLHNGCDEECTFTP